ncbi:hypothetical protein B0H17DRAFT_1180834 [Mycena rosella]|uniref:Uncharacterized protein n=1 Tax=Mycena rosella TaxID=1033263 RepID=A0AAD7DBI5_MYCRO|nr:hypothetical protein B0H17DRAFT_1180834 [Mycena rosella]
METALRRTLTNMKLAARPKNSSQQLAFDRAVISAPLVNNQTPVEVFYDNLDTIVLNYAGDWGTSTADGIPNATVTHPWHNTSILGASVSMDIEVGAVGVSLWGMANWGNWIYTVFIDGGAQNTYNGSTFCKVPDALLFYQGGLDPTKNHTVSLINASNLNLALNSIRVQRIAATVTSSSSGTRVTTSSTHTSAHSGVRAGVIAGSILGAVLLTIVCGFLWWRLRRNRFRASTTQDMVQINGYIGRSAHLPSTGYSEATSMIALTSTAHSPTYLAPVIQSSGPPGATVTPYPTTLPTPRRACLSARAMGTALLRRASTHLFPRVLVGAGREDA